MAGGILVTEGCSGWCAPVIIYVVLAVLGILFALFTPATRRGWALLFTILWAVLWTALLYWLCRNCHVGAAWILLLLPVIIFLIGALVVGLVVLL